MNAGWFWVAGLISLISIGCGASAQPTAIAHTHAHPAAGHSHNASDHNHPRGKMLMASDGTTSALLTAHLSPEGNELDIFFERNGAPHAIDAKVVVATIEDATGNPSRDATFECAPENERPKGERAGTCSHYVARVPWMSRTQVLKVTSTVFVWRDFVPVTYAHHDG